MIDRFDITLKFEDEDTEESANNYAKQKIEVSKMLPHNYNFLRKFLHYIRNTITKVTFTKEAEIMIAKYYASIKVNKPCYDTQGF